MKNIYAITLLAAVFAVTGCFTEKAETPGNESGNTVITANVSNVRTALDGKKVFWTSGDKISVNGIESAALNLTENAASAEFSFASELSAPYCAIFPASIYKDAATVTLPAVQQACEGSFHASASPMIAWEASSSALTFVHPCAVIRFEISSVPAGDQISHVEFSGNAAEQVSGDFTVDYETLSLTPASSADEDKLVTVQVGRDNPGKIHIVVPAGNYPQGYTVRIISASGMSMQMQTSARTLEPGVIYTFEDAVEFIPQGDLLSGYDVVAENMMDANEIIPYNEKCLVLRGKDLKIYRMAYNEADGTFAEAEFKQDWSAYVTMWLAKTPGNYMHFGNMYNTWATYNCGDDFSNPPAWDQLTAYDPNNLAAGEGVVIAGADSFWPVRTGHPDGIIGINPDGNMTFYKLSPTSCLVANPAGGFMAGISTGFNWATSYVGYPFCWGREFVAIDIDGNMWYHKWNAQTMTYSPERTQIGSGWTAVSHLIPFGDALLVRTPDGRLVCIDDFSLDKFWAL